MRINWDSQSEIFLVTNITYHSKIEHIDVQYHFVRDMVESEKVLLEKIDALCCGVFLPKQCARR